MSFLERSVPPAILPAIAGDTHPWRNDQIVSARPNGVGQFGASRLRDALQRDAERPEGGLGLGRVSTVPDGTPSMPFSRLGL